MHARLRVALAAPPPIDPERRQAALETIQRGALTLQGPMMLKQGFIGVVPRLPIFIENVTDPNERFG
jgi:sensor domain CHASE-containing protein